MRDEDELAAAKAITKAIRASDEDGLAAAKAGGGCVIVCLCVAKEKGLDARSIKVPTNSNKLADIPMMSIL
ncbi:hypothetical protein L1987_22217 [Smallanthus sonchifolius]|uniref:Uncharacterized protein n=1 Tax=Smallanthus sonchifolius TaxID=185202 RepID=A0ACB9IDJ3_9ASTR|nr:hypothetical protein L1987_22217 [Smallanthus sonchifolius]